MNCQKEHTLTDSSCGDVKVELVNSAFERIDVKHFFCFVVESQPVCNFDVVDLTLQLSLVVESVQRTQWFSFSYV
jgi:hypothetical protein